jgi:GNAT superfamily N-acetyltransferase
MRRTGQGFRGAKRGTRFTAICSDILKIHKVPDVVLQKDCCVHPFRRLAELIEDWKYLIRRDGKSALPAVGLEIARLPYRHRRFLIVARSLTEPLPDLTPKIELEIRLFELADLDFVRQIDRPSEARACARRLERGHTGFLASHQGQVVGYAWACTEVNPSLERVQLSLAHGDVLCVDAYTTPAFRGKGVQTALALARCRVFRDRGFLRAIAYIESRNHPSLAVWRKIGGQAAGQIDFQRIGPWRRVRYNLDHAIDEPGSNTKLVEKDGDQQDIPM